MSNARPTDIFNLCQFTFANGRMCGLPAHPKGEGLCLTHFRATKAKPDPREDDLSADLRSPAGDYITQIDINHVLGKLFDALAANRLSPRRASSLAYIVFLLMQSQEGAKDEARRWFIDYPVFKQLLKLKYPKDHPYYPKDVKPAPAQSRRRSSSAKSDAPDAAPASTPKPAAKSARAKSRRTSPSPEPLAAAPAAKPLTTQSRPGSSPSKPNGSEAHPATTHKRAAKSAHSHTKSRQPAPPLESPPAGHAPPIISEPAPQSTSVQ